MSSPIGTMTPLFSPNTDEAIRAQEANSLTRKGFRRTQHLSRCQQPGSVFQAARMAENKVVLLKDREITLMKPVVLFTVSVQEGSLLRTSWANIHLVKPFHFGETKTHLSVSWEMKPVEPEKVKTKPPKLKPLKSDYKDIRKQLADRVKRNNRVEDQRPPVGIQVIKGSLKLGSTYYAVATVKKPVSAARESLNKQPSPKPESYDPSVVCKACEKMYIKTPSMILGCTYKIMAMDGKLHSTTLV